MASRTGCYRCLVSDIASSLTTLFSSRSLVYVLNLWAASSRVEWRCRKPSDPCTRFLVERSAHRGSCWRTCETRVYPGSGPHSEVIPYILHVFYWCGLVWGVHVLDLLNASLGGPYLPLYRWMRGRVTWLVSKVLYESCLTVQVMVYPSRGGPPLEASVPNNNRAPRPAWRPYFPEVGYPWCIAM